MPKKDKGKGFYNRFRYSEYIIFSNINIVYLAIRKSIDLLLPPLSRVIQFFNKIRSLKEQLER
jgi:hypothetical protein